jgi:hypothetical protein
VRATAAATEFRSTRRVLSAAVTVDQLRAVSDRCVTMCPLCLVNLTKAAEGQIAFRDISEVLLEAQERLTQAGEDVRSR